MTNGEKRPCDARIPGGWPELVTLWATEDDSRHRERILMEHSLLMKVVERKALEAFRRAMDNPETDWKPHLDAGLGYDLDHLEQEMEAVFGNLDDVQALHDQAIETLGDARRAVRRAKGAESQKRACQRLLHAVERLYDRIECRVDAQSRRKFIEDGLRQTETWLDRNDDPNGKVVAQRDRLLNAQRRHSDRRPPRRRAA